MKIRSQVGMVLNLDKCIGCHTCSVTCKNVEGGTADWGTGESPQQETNREPAE